MAAGLTACRGPEGTVDNRPAAVHVDTKAGGFTILSSLFSCLLYPVYPSFSPLICLFPPSTGAALGPAGFCPVSCGLCRKAACAQMMQCFCLCSRHRRSVSAPLDRLVTGDSEAFKATFKASLD